MINYIKYILLALIFISLTNCKKTDWRENYNEKKKTPFGTYILFQESEKLFDYYSNILIDQNIYDFISDEENEAYGTFNYICIKNSAYKIDTTGIQRILSNVYQGSTAFFSLNYYSSTLEDALQIKVQNLDSTSYKPSQLKKLFGTLHLNNDDFSDKSYHFDRNLRRNYFSNYNKKNTIVLGTQKINNKEQPIFLKIYHGKGSIYVHTQPVVFSNYNMLKGKHEYATNVLSYLPSDVNYWDPQLYWPGYNNQEKESSSILSFFWENESLKWFLNLCFIGLILFMIFNVRRKQRAIPVLAESKNSTLEFTKTISAFYLKSNNHKDLIDKKIAFFFNKVRSQYRLDTHKIDGKFIERLALKSGNNLQSTKYLVNSILSIQKKYECTEEDLMVLNKMINNFLKPK